MSKCKFKVGDMVIGNSYHYVHTCKGWIGRVTKVNGNGTFEARGKSKTGVEVTFTGLEPEYFDLYTKDQPTKIVITTDGKTTTAKMYRDKSVVKVATIKCHPDDRFDFEVGARIAFDRLVGCKKEEPEKPKYYNGKVVCVDTTDTTCGYVLGKIYEIKDGYLYVDGRRFFPTTPVSTVAEFNACSNAKWLEVVE